jgi:hypothetical protein
MKKTAIVCVLFVVFTFVVCVAAHAVSARDLNAQGYDLYKAGKYPEALALFKRSVAADPDYALAHYNLACTLGVLRKRGGEAICRYDAYKSVILDHLEAAVRLDPDTLMKVSGDPDLDPVRDTFRYLRIVGVSPDDEDGIRTILVHVTWYGPAPGAFGPASGLTFHEDGTLVLWTLDTTGESVKRVEIAGSFLVSGNQVTVTLEKPLGDTAVFKGLLMPGGTLDIPGLPGPFNDNPHDCEA